MPDLTAQVLTELKAAYPARLTAQSLAHDLGANAGSVRRVLLHLAYRDAVEILYGNGSAPHLYRYPSALIAPVAEFSNG